ncbi:hypothetical protein IAD21_01245 [Abditibacteriota bacterium]|nr:hypothetical protein IAD21_01245 [Abditibacteriota bacterium]
MFWEHLLRGGAFELALSATGKVFLMGVAGYLLIAYGVLKDESLNAFSGLVAYLTLPCLILSSFSAHFDTKGYPYWWQLVLAGAALQVVQIAIGWLVSRRYSREQGRDELIMLIGFQNSGFFVLPMLQGLVPGKEFGHASVLLFLFIIFFNASFWPVGTRVLLRQRGFDLKRILLAPPTLATFVALVLFGLLPGPSHAFQKTLLGGMLFGTDSPGALTLLGNLTVPLATLVLGGTIGQVSSRGLSGFGINGATIEIALWKLVLIPAVGWLIIHFIPGMFLDRSLRLLTMLEFSAPMAMNVAIFCQQYNIPMKLTPISCLFCYALCLLTVPFWCALVL